MNIGGRFERNAHFEAPTCLVSILWFSSAVAVSMGEATKSLLFEGFNAGYRAVLRGRRGTRDILTCVQTRRKSFCVAGAIFLRRFQKMGCTFRGRRSTLESSFCAAGATL